jgi:hypothetical protein
VLNITLVKYSQSTLFQRVTGDYSKLNGLWKGITSTGEVLRTEIENGLYLSYTVGNIDTLTGINAYYGLLQPNNNATAKLTYVQTHNNQPTKGTVLPAVQYKTDGDTFNLFETTGNIRFNATFTAKASASILEGVWVGIVTGSECSLTIQFKTELYRNFVVCNYGSQSNLAQLGLFKIVNSTHMRIGFGYSNQANLIGTSRLLTYKLTNGDSELEVLDIESGNISKLKKATLPPRAIPMEMRLNTTFADFKDSNQLKVFDAISNKTGLPRSLFFIVGRRQGSVILQVALIDDQSSGVDASTQYNKLSQTSSIGDYSVLSIYNIETPSSNTNFANQYSLNIFIGLFIFVVCLFQ